MTPLALYSNETVVEEPVDQSTLTERYTAEAIRFIEENHDWPLFLYVPHTFPHVSLHMYHHVSRAVPRLAFMVMWLNPLTGV